MDWDTLQKQAAAEDPIAEQLLVLADAAEQEGAGLAESLNAARVQMGLGPLMGESDGYGDGHGDGYGDGSYGYGYGYGDGYGYGNGDGYGYGNGGSE